MQAADLPKFRNSILNIVASGTADWLELAFEEAGKTWVLVAPGVPVTLDEDDPPEPPPMPDFSELLGR